MSSDRPQIRSGLNRLPECIEISAYMFHGSLVKSGLPLNSPPSVLMAPDLSNELILLHPRPDCLGPICGVATSLREM